MRNNGAPLLTKVDQLHSVALSSGLTTCTLLSNLGCQRCPAQSGAVCVRVSSCSGARHLKCACLAPEPMWHRADALSPIAIPDDQTALSTATKLLYYTLCSAKRLSPPAKLSTKSSRFRRPAPLQHAQQTTPKHLQLGVRIDLGFSVLFTILSVTFSSLCNFFCRFLKRNVPQHCCATVDHGRVGCRVRKLGGRRVHDVRGGSGAVGPLRCEGRRGPMLEPLAETLSMGIC